MVPSVSLALALIMSAIGPVSGTHMNRAVHDELARRNAESMTTMNAVIGQYPKQWNEWVSRIPQLGEMPAEFNVVFGLPPGGISGIVKSPYGYHIFRLEDRRKAGTISIADASREIADRLRHDKQDARYKQWLKVLRARTKFEVNYQALEQ